MSCPNPIVEGVVSDTIDATTIVYSPSVSTSFGSHVGGGVEAISIDYTLSGGYGNDSEEDFDGYTSVGSHVDAGSTIV